MFKKEFITICKKNPPKNITSAGDNFIIYIFTCFVVSAIFEKYVDRTAIKISRRFSSKIFEK